MPPLTQCSAKSCPLNFTPNTSMLHTAHAVGDKWVICTADMHLKVDTLKAVTCIAGGVLTNECMPKSYHRQDSQKYGKCCHYTMRKCLFEFWTNQSLSSAGDTTSFLYSMRSRWTGSQSALQEAFHSCISEEPVCHHWILATTLTSVPHQSVMMLMLSDNFSCRLKPPSHSGSNSICWPVFLVTESIPYQQHMTPSLSSAKVKGTMQTIIISHQPKHHRSHRHFTSSGRFSK